MLMYDIKKAHRRIPVLKSEWGRQACQVKGSAALSRLAKKAKGGAAAMGKLSLEGRETR